MHSIVRSHDIAILIVQLCALLHHVASSALIIIFRDDS